MADSKPAKQEVNGTVILPPLVFPDMTITTGAKNGLQNGLKLVLVSKL